MEEELKQQKFNYKIQQLNDTDFVLYLTYEYDNSWMLDKIMEVLKKKNKLTHAMDESEAKKILEYTQEFSLPDEVKKQYCWAMHKGILGHIATVRKTILKEDKVDLLNHRCTDVKYTKINKDKWKCEVKIEGSMIRR